MTQQKGKPGRKPAPEAERKISISAIIPRPLYNQLLNACKRQNRTISAIVGEAVENVIKGRTAADSGPTRGEAFGSIIAATIADPNDYLETLEDIAIQPAKILAFARKLDGGLTELLDQIPAGAFDLPLTDPEAAEMELSFLQARRGRAALDDLENGKN